MMIINDIISIFEDYAPSALQESYDNSGLITGNKKLAYYQCFNYFRLY